MDDHDFGTSTNREQNQNIIQPNDQNKPYSNADEHEHNDSNVERPTISVVIDEDEEESREVVGMASGDDLNPSSFSNESHGRKSEGISFPYSDHIYMTGKFNPENQDAQFPIINGLDIDEMADYPNVPFSIKPQLASRSPVKRISGYGYNESDINGGRNTHYYRQQMKGDPQKYISIASSQQQFQSRSNRLPPTLRPVVANRGRAAATSLDSPYASSSIRTGHSLPPPIQQRHSQSEFDGMPAPMVTASRGRPAGSKNIARNNRHAYGNRELASPPPDDLSHTYTTRSRPSNYQQKRQASTSYHYQQDDHEQHNTYVEEEEKLNESFFSEQRNKFASTGRGRRPRNSKKIFPPADPMHVHEDMKQQDEHSKPPDDPYLPPQQMLPRIGAHQRHNFFEPSTTLDGTIASVVRGEASVWHLEHNFVSPQNMNPSINRQSFQSQTQMNSPNVTGIESHDQSGNTQLSHQRLDELAELAQASSNLLEQTTSSMARNKAYQQQYPQPQQTLHFKVVQTSHQEQEQLFQHDYRQQQVFTIEQRTDQLPPNLEEQSNDELNERKSRKQIEYPKLKRMTKRQAAAAESLQSQTSTSSTAEKFSTKTEHDVKYEEKAPKTEIRKQRKSKYSKQDYTTRCICEMSHNDPFMIQCDKCDVWQHGVCMAISEDAVPDKYYCEKCSPRRLAISAKQAQKIQKSALAKLEAQKRRKKTAQLFKKKALATKNNKRGLGIRHGHLKMKKHLGKAPTTKRIPKSPVKYKVKKEEPDDSDVSEHPDFILTKQNHCSRMVRSLVSKMQPYVLGGIGLLKRLETLRQPLCRQMYVAPNILGLVATPGKNTHLPAGMPIVEYRGEMSLLSEIKSRAPNKPIEHEFTLIYNGLDDMNKIFMDATKMGSIARVIRRSCRPNATVQHAIIDRQLRIYLYATTIIDNTTEITIPFDYNYHESSKPIECACGLDSLITEQGWHCPVNEFNKTLQTIQEGNTTNSQLKQKESNPQHSTSKVTRGMKSAEKSPMDPEETSLPPIKNEVLSSPEKDESHKREKHANESSLTDQEGRKLRARNLPKSEEILLPQRAIRQKPSILIKEEQEVIGTSKSRANKASSSSYADFVDSSSSSSTQMQTSKNVGGLPILVNAYRQQPSSSASPAPKKRGRPSKKKVDMPAEPKKETMDVSEDGKMSREERNMQAKIAAFERSQQKKRRQSDNTSESSPIKKARTNQQKKATPSTSKVSTKSKNADLSILNLWTELSKVARKTIKKEVDFTLPSDFDTLRTELAKQTTFHPTTKASKKEDANSRAKSDAHIPVEGKAVEISPVLDEMSKEGQHQQPLPKANVEKSDVVMEIDVQVATPVELRPNTKEQKKLTIAEYRRKKQAELAAGNVTEASSVNKDQPGHSFTSTLATRQSPRKSFMPTIGGVPSPPQQLDDFAPQSPPGIAVNRQSAIRTPSLDELKKRINNTGAGSHSGEGPSSHPPLPLDPPMPKQQAEQRTSSLDERLKRLVRRGGNQV